MPVALVDFNAMYGGELVTIRKGEIFVEGHELHRRFPDKFASNSSSGRGERRPARPRRSSVNVSAATRGPAAALDLAGLSPSNYFVATRDFVANDGRIMRRGASVVGGDSEYVKRYPDRFQLLGPGKRINARRSRPTVARYVGPPRSARDEVPQTASYARYNVLI